MNLITVCVGCAESRRRQLRLSVSVLAVAAVALTAPGARAEPAASVSKDLSIYVDIPAVGFTSSWLDKNIEFPDEIAKNKGLTEHHTTLTTGGTPSFNVHYRSYGLFLGQTHVAGGYYVTDTLLVGVYLSLSRTRNSNPSLFDQQDENSDVHDDRLGPYLLHQTVLTEDIGLESEAYATWNLYMEDQNNSDSNGGPSIIHSKSGPNYTWVVASHVVWRLASRFHVLTGLSYHDRRSKYDESGNVGGGQYHDVQTAHYQDLNVDFAMARFYL